MISALLQRLVVNFSGRVRRAKHQGRDYLVAPMVLINPGVLNGSKGALLYPPDEVAKNPRQWNGVPIVVYHPHRLGQPVSASAPGVLDSQGIGEVRNATSNGKLRAEGWFDAEKTRRVNPSVYNRLLKNEPIELSTGLYTDNEEQSGTFNGRQYEAIARNYRPDHLAILPDQVGACSVKDGCGVLVNKENRMSIQDKLSVLVDNAWSDEAREAAAEARKNKASGVSDPDDDLVEIGVSHGDGTVTRSPDYGRRGRLPDDPNKKKEFRPDPVKLRAALEQRDRLMKLTGNDEEENCDEKMEKNCDQPLSNKLYSILNAKKNEEADKNRTVELSTDNPRQSMMAKDAEDHDLINDDAKSPAKKVKSSVEKKYQGNLKDSEDENEDTVQNKLNALLGNSNPEGHNQYTKGTAVGEKSEIEWPEETTDESMSGLKEKKPHTKKSGVTGAGFGPGGSPSRGSQGSGSYNQLNIKLNTLVGNWGGPPQGPPQGLPSNIRNQEGGPTMANVKLTNKERKAVVDGLIANSACCWEESDREVLNGLTDVTLAKLHKQMEIVANAVAEEDSDEDVAVEEEPTKKGTSQADGKVEPTGELDPKMKTNREAVLNAQDRADLAFARRYRMEQRQQHVKAITANANNKFTAKQLEAMSDTVLANMAALAQEPTNNEGVDTYVYRPNFFGQQGTVVTNVGAVADEEPLTLGKIDYKELAASNGNHR